MNTLILYAMGLASLAVIIAGAFFLDYDCVLHPSSMVKNFCMCKKYDGISAKQAGF